MLIMAFEGSYHKKISVLCIDLSKKFLDPVSDYLMYLICIRLGCKEFVHLWSGHNM